MATEQVPLCTTALNWVVWVKAAEVYEVRPEVVAMSLQVVPSVELCHLVTVPVLPANVNKPLVLPEQMAVPPVTTPPTEVGSTVTVMAAELLTEQLPLWTTALNCVAWVSAPEVYVAEVLIISLQEVYGETELCHFTTVPVWPDKVSVPLVLPMQTLAAPEMAPPTEVGSTVTVVAAEIDVEQTPLWTTALNSVVSESAPEV